MKIAIPEFGTPQPNYRAALTALGVEPVQVGEDVDPGIYGGLLLPGGADIDPARYCEENKGSVGIDTALDELQFGVLDKFIKSGKPVLGICRGHQLISVYFGSKLIQHLPSSDIHAHEEGRVTDKIHKALAVPGTVIYDLYGSEYVINSSHHQAVSEPSKALKTMAMSDDGVIEALYHECLPVISVQWHPERMCFEFADNNVSDGSIIIDAFLKMCSI